MTKDLSDIDWTGLETAYGDASKVPGLIRQAGDSNASKSRKAISELANLVNHQGYPFDSARPVVPFLANLCLSEETGARDAALELFADLAIGGMPEHFVGSGITWEQGLQEGIVPEEGVAAREAAVPLAPRLLPLCTHMTAAMRARAIFAVALAIPSKELLERFQELVTKEKNQGVKATLAWAQGFICSQTNEVAPAVLTELTNSNHPLVAGAACLGLSLSGSDLTEEQVSTLVAWAEEGQKAPDTFPVARLGLRALADDALTSRIRLHEDIDLLIALIQRGPVTDSLVSSLSHFFQKRERATLASQLSSDERKILQALRSTSAHIRTLPEFGVAAVRAEGLNIYLGTSDSLLTRDVGGVPLWYAYTNAIHGWSDGNAWQEFVDKSSGSELFELFVEIEVERPHVYFPWSCRGMPGSLTELERARTETQKVEFCSSAFLQRCSERELRQLAEQVPATAPTLSACLLVAMARTAPRQLAGLEEQFKIAHRAAAINLREALRHFPEDFQGLMAKKSAHNAYYAAFFVSEFGNAELKAAVTKRLALQTDEPLPEAWADEVFPKIAEQARPVAEELLETNQVKSEAVANQLQKQLKQ